jgi:outer membrane protein OmpA-like peptidoglycan-associated protein
VYRARDTRLHRLVALKVMHPHLQGAREARQRFAREAVTVARLHHPSILEIYDYSGEDSEVSFIATELLTGPTLRRFADEHPNIPPEIAACITLQVARGTPVHISIWRQRQRVRVYINQEKTWDVPRAILADAKLNAVILFLPGADANMEYFVSNVRMATGAPDTRNKILTQGKWVSHGILFDVNSDRLKGESYGSLKEIATVLTENADLKVQIVGHTDSDGDEAANLDLSKRRAASVKTALVTQFAIDAGRMDTDGKGEGQPAEPNDTPAGKANNRRVEFIKR